jgi:hypothetical protein
MKIRPTWLPILMMFCFAARLSTEGVKGNRFAISPDSKWIAQIGPGSQGGQQLTIQDTRGPQPRRILWQSVRWVEVDWSPDSQYLAVTDHYDGHEAAILIFAVPTAVHADFALIFQTPREPDSQIAWSLENWDVEKRRVALLKTEDLLGQQPRYRRSVRYFQLGTSVLKQTLYDSF